MLAMGLKSPESRGFCGIIKTAPKSACNTRRGLTHSTGTSREGLPDMVPKTCSFEACEKPRHAADLCSGHRKQQRKGQELRPLWTKPASIAEIIETHTDRTGDCWTWTRAKDRNGYGKQWWEGRLWLAHRLSYIDQHGPIPDGLFIDHICRNPQCVKPSHLRLATQKQNQENLTRLYAASGYRGVIRRTSGKSWRAEVTHNRVAHTRSGFATPEEADAAAREMRLELFTHNDMDRRTA